MPRWAAALLCRLAPSDRADEILGDFEEVHRRRVERRGRLVAWLLSGIEALDMARALAAGGRRPGRASGSPGPNGSSFSWLDFKLGLRMLVKHPGLTVLGGLSISFAIFVGTMAFELMTQALRPDVPLPGGDRIVVVRLWNASQGGTQPRVLWDAEVWREELRTVEDLVVYRERPRNLITPDGRSEPVVVAEMGVGGLAFARVPPLLGRTLTEEDGRAGAPPVVVLGHAVWTGRFGGDPQIVGRDIRLGDTPTTVVGVMPEGFGFPVAHDMWMPLGADAVAYGPQDGPPVVVLARLTERASPEDARAELTLLGKRLAESYPETYADLQPRVDLLPRAVLGLPSGVSGLLLGTLGLTSNLPLLLFLVLVCGNVGLLMFARAASREGELVVRSALGASRRRIVTQLFVEALVLALAAAAVGLAAARLGLVWVFGIVREEVFEGEPLPFWIDTGLSPETLVYAVLMAVVAALVAGALPGLRVTRSLGEGLKRGTAGGGGFRFGGVWTLVIAGQIVLTMLFPLVTVAVRAEGQVELDYEPPFRLEEYAVARVRAESGGAPRARASDSPAGLLAVRLDERLTAEPEVTSVAVAERLPMTYHPWNQVEIDGSTAPAGGRGHRVGSARVSTDFFDVMGARIVAGRGFHTSDLEEGARSVVVDDAFVDRVLGGRNALGARVRYRADEDQRDPTREPGAWFTIVGVVEEIGARCFYGPGGIYHPVRPEALAEPWVIAHVPAGAAGFASRVRGLAAAVDPTAGLHDVETLEEATSGPRDFYAAWTVVLVAVSGLALLLSLGGIYAVMAYTVAQRTREIGIRVALGSSRLRVVAAVFRQPLRQVALGLGAGFVLLSVVLLGLSENLDTLRALGGLTAYCLAIGLVCLSACGVPTRRALAVEPGEALRVEG